jgi:TRAP-type C4-dicarboxylate transport system permease small subunit
MAEEPSALPLTRSPPIVAAVDRAVGRALETICVVLLVVETLILFAGVIWRYLLHKPLVWSDELASTLFLWLGMLGARSPSGAARTCA